MSTADRRPRTGVWLFPDAPAARFVDAVAHAEACGLDEVWVGDEGPARDPFALCAAAAVRTERLGLAVGVTNPYLRHPAATASLAVTLAELSGDRFTLGLGPGGHLSLDPVGIRPQRPLTDCRRALSIIRAVAAGEAVDGYDPPGHAVSRPGLPVFVGARGERFNRWASEAADGVFVAGVAPGAMGDVVGWARSVRPVEVALYVSVCVDADALEVLRPGMIHTLAVAPAALRAAAGVDDDVLADAVAAHGAGEPGPARAVLTDDVLAEVLVWGTPERIAARCRELFVRHRAERVGLALLGGDPLGQIDAAAWVLDRALA